MFTFQHLITFKNLSLSNCDYLSAKFNNGGLDYIRLTFSTTPILCHGSESNQLLFLKCESITFIIGKEGFKNMRLLKSNSDFRDSGYLLLPYSTGSTISLDFQKLWQNKNHQNSKR